MPRSPQSLAGEYGQRKRWGGVVNRTAETAKAREAGPASIDYWLDKLGPQFADATDKQKLDAAESLRKAHYTRMAMLSAKARRKADPPRDAA